VKKHTKLRLVSIEGGLLSKTPPPLQRLPLAGSKYPLRISRFAALRRKRCRL